MCSGANSELYCHILSLRVRLYFQISMNSVQMNLSIISAKDVIMQSLILYKNIQLLKTMCLERNCFILNIAAGLAATAHEEVWELAEQTPCWQGELGGCMLLIGDWLLIFKSLWVKEGKLFCFADKTHCEAKPYLRRKKSVLNGNKISKLSWNKVCNDSSFF